MNLAIDFGNTSVKAGLFNGHILSEFKAYSSINDLKSDSSFLKQAQNCVVGSVTHQHEVLSSILDPRCRIIEFSSQSKTPLVNLYKSASTLGSDRLAASVGAYTIYPNKNTLVIDSGTCLKFNFTNQKNEFLGGAISPGLHMRFKALHEQTAKLPLVKFDSSFSKLIGENTEESILSGVINGFTGEMEFVISEYKKQYPDLIAVVTGGDHVFLAKHLKSRIFAHPYLVLTGLNEILKYNS
jgi:type III pantothenate kinase